MKSLVLIVLVFSFSGCVRYSSYKQTYENGSSRSSQVHIRPPAPHDQLVFAYRIEGSNAVFDSEKVTLVFPGLSSGERNSFSFKDGSLPIQIAGSGISKAAVNCRRNLGHSSFQSRFEEGVTTINFCGREVKLADHARVAVVDGQSIDLSNGKQEVFVLARARQ